jgi:Leucine-rich repeat (LRR) protein
MRSVEWMLLCVPACMAAQSHAGAASCGWIRQRLSGPDGCRNKLEGNISTPKLPGGLQELRLSQNQLRSLPAPLPEELATLELHGNPLNSTISTAWDLPLSLKRLTLANASLRGSIPLDWGLPAGLEELFLESNELEGEVASSKYWVAAHAAGAAAVAVPAGRTAASFASSGMHAPQIRMAGCGREEGFHYVNPVVGLFCHSCHDAGTLPSWPDMTNLSIFIQPGNDRLRGQVRSKEL